MRRGLAGSPSEVVQLSTSSISPEAAVYLRRERGGWSSGRDRLAGDFMRAMQIEENSDRDTGTRTAASGRQ
jgi:hypothetical protein